MAGRTMLIKAVAMAIPLYLMQTYLLPTSLCDKMDGMIQKFWWGAQDKKRPFCLKAWDAICMHKATSGLGIRRLKDINIAYITKLGWQFCIESNRIYVKLVRSKYLRGRRVLDF